MSRFCGFLLTLILLATNVRMSWPASVLLWKPIGLPCTTDCIVSNRSRYKKKGLRCFFVKWSNTNYCHSTKKVLKTLDFKFSQQLTKLTKPVLSYTINTITGLGLFRKHVSNWQMNHHVHFVELMNILTFATFSTAPTLRMFVISLQNCSIPPLYKTNRNALQYPFWLIS